jgi:hypothetical protein
MMPLPAAAAPLRLPAALLLTLAVLALGVPAAAQELPTHDAFTDVLEEVVHGARVDYAGLQEGRSALDAYLATLASTPEAALEGATREARLAFWINAYNACMLRLVVDHYPIEAGGGLFDRIRNAVADRPDNSVWQIDDVFTGDHCRVAGAERSQDEIEHEIIRPIGEPRIHFAVNCAARSCPPLRAEAYTAGALDAQLDAQVRDFVANPSHFRLEDGTPPVLRLNKVLDWYGEDFGGPDGLKTFFQSYLPEPRAALLAEPDTRVDFFEYDWTLNDTES